MGRPRPVGAPVLRQVHLISEDEARGVLPGEQDREASADASGGERHDEDNGDELGVHHECCPQMQPRSPLNVTR